MANILEGVNSAGTLLEKGSATSGMGGGRSLTPSVGKSCGAGIVRHTVRRICKYQSRRENVRGLVVCSTLHGMGQEGQAWVERFRELGNQNLCSFGKCIVPPSSSEKLTSTRGARLYTYK